MRTIAEMNLLIRACVDRHCLQLTADHFRKGWQLVQPEDAGELKRRMRASEWNFIRIGAGILKSGFKEIHRGKRSIAHSNGLFAC